MILYENSKLVAIATGISRPTENPKTGDMVQVWILPASEAPGDAVRSGGDKVVCGDCPLRPAAGGGCYVQVEWAPGSVWRAWKQGKYERWSGDAGVFEGRMVRWGAWGDPAFLPVSLLRKVNRVARGWTGYTHQWRRAGKQRHRRYLMASVESQWDAGMARALGWRTFRVAGRWEWNQGAGDREEFWCPASREMGSRSTCERCGLCSGSGGKGEGIKSVRILAHGSQGKRAVRE